MAKSKNPLWQFFASVKLALATLIILASTAIIGTLIQQGKEPAYYVEKYGEGLAGVMQALNLPTMYSSWWFDGLLGLFAINLLVCSIERLPAVWRMVVLDNLAMDPAQLEKMGTTHVMDARITTEAAAERIREQLAASGWSKSRRRDYDSSVLLFAQKGAWSRLGVYLVHLSILIIFAGALTGSIFGFKAYVFLPEGRSTTQVFLQGSGEPVPLGFELRCDRFDTLTFSNGRILGERSYLTVLDPELKEPLQKSVIVNDPLTYRGITFFKANAYPMEEYFVVIRNQATGDEQAFRVPGARDVAWPGTKISFRIDEVRRDQDGVVQQAKIQLVTDVGSEPTTAWVSDRETVVVRGASGEFSIAFRQLYSSLLLATKDPGIWIFYSGCGLMVIGLMVSFTLSHRRIWVRISPADKPGTRILLTGTSNKQKPAFELRFKELASRLEKAMAPPGRSKKTR